MKITHLNHRGILEIQGEDRTPFLQGLISNDIHCVTSKKAIYATLLSPNGRFLYDFFITKKDESYYLDVELGRLPDLIKKLNIYRLRSRVTFMPRPDLKIFALWDENFGSPIFDLSEKKWAEENIFIDPRLLEMGARIMGTVPYTEAQAAPFQDYEIHRLSLGIPEGGKDLVPEKSILLESGLDELNAISWTKGCYIGQELTTRTKFLGLVRKRLIPLKIEGPAPEFGSEIFLDQTSVGVMRTHADKYGLALLRLENLKMNEEGQGGLQCGKALLTPFKPIWMKIDEI